MLVLYAWIIWAAMDCSVSVVFGIIIRRTRPDWIMVDSSLRTQETGRLSPPVSKQRDGMLHTSTISFFKRNPASHSLDDRMRKSSLA